MNTLPPLRLLVAGCLALLLGLLGVQGYLVWNTYQLTAATYRTELRQALLQLHDEPAYAAILARQQQQELRMAEQYARGQLSSARFQQQLRASAEAMSQQLNSYLRQQARRQPLLRHVAERCYYTNLLVRRPGRVDTVLVRPPEPLRLTGSQRGGHYSFDMGTSQYLSSFTSQVAGHPVAASVESNLVQQVDISAWQSQLWRRMGAVAGLTALLLAAVVVLFYYVLQSALRQRQLAELRTDLANNITHELKTPLSSLGIILKSLQRPDVQQDPSKLPPLVQALARQYERLNQTVEQVLASAMVGTTVVSLQELDVTVYLNSYMQHFLTTTHDVRFAVAPGCQLLRTNAQVLETVLNNLLDNAQKYSPPGSVITVRGQPGATHYALEIQDAGPGIAPAYRAHIFDKFYRAPEQNRHAVKGLGLGLYLSRQAVEQVGGRLTLARSSPQGSTFLLELPLA